MDYENLEKYRKKRDRLIIGLLIASFALGIFSVSILPDYMPENRLRESPIFFVNTIQQIYNNSPKKNRKLSSADPEDIISTLSESPAMNGSHGSSPAKSTMNFNYSGRIGGINQQASGAGGGSGSGGAGFMMYSGRKSNGGDAGISNNGGSSMSSMQLAAASTPFTNPQRVTSDAASITGGGDPGFAPYGSPLPVGDGMLAIFLFSAFYLASKSYLRLRKGL